MTPQELLPIFEEIIDYMIEDENDSSVLTYLHMWFSGEDATQAWNLTKKHMYNIIDNRNSEFTHIKQVGLEALKLVVRDLKEEIKQQENETN